MGIDAHSLTLAIPAYNEVATLAGVVHEALQVLPALARRFEILVVDDGSTDGTGPLADRLSLEHSQVRVVHHPTNRGFSGAMRTGLWGATAEWVALGPADCQARWEDLARFFEIADSYDMIFSYRTGRRDPIYRKLTSRLWFAWLRFLFGIEIPQFSSLFLFRRSAVQQLQVGVRDRASNMLPALYLRACQLRLRVGLVGTVQPARAGGRSKGGNLPNAFRTVTEDLALWWRWRVLGQCS
jgi:glycosyltransferase involved in cell wall biosynthesis